MASEKVQLPTQCRFMDHSEYRIVSRVFGGTLPLRIRIVITDAAGLDGRAFTIPTSLLSMLLNIPVSSYFAGVGSSIAVGYLASCINLAYLINVGDSYDTLTTSDTNVLVHETAHVWQGKNSIFALTYVFDSIYNQCIRSNAYAYSPGKPWSSYNVEQQASIVEDWYVSGEPSFGSLYPYIVNHVRRGDA